MPSKDEKKHYWLNKKSWQPPSHWIYGVCQDCQKSFKPALPKQYYCYDCRTAGSLQQEMLDVRVWSTRKVKPEDDQPVGILRDSGWKYKLSKSDEFGFWQDPLTKRWFNTTQALIEQKFREAKRESRHTLP